MPIKFTKDVSAHLFKYIRTIDIKFNPFDRRTTSARELLRQVQASRFKKSNPRLQIGIDVHNRADAPTAAFHFIDGTEVLYETNDNNVNEMLFQIHLKTMQMDAEFEMEGKSIDEV